MPLCRSGQAAFPPVPAWHEPRSKIKRAPGRRHGQTPPCSRTGVRMERPRRGWLTNFGAVASDRLGTARSALSQRGTKSPTMCRNLIQISALGTRGRCFPFRRPLKRGRPATATGRTPFLSAWLALAGHDLLRLCLLRREQQPVRCLDCGFGRKRNRHSVGAVDEHDAFFGFGFARVVMNESVHRTSARKAPFGSAFSTSLWVTSAQARCNLCSRCSPKAGPDARNRTNGGTPKS